MIRFLVIDVTVKPVDEVAIFPDAIPSLALVDLVTFTILLTFKPFAFVLEKLDWAVSDDE